MTWIAIFMVFCYYAQDRNNQPATQLRYPARSLCANACCRHGKLPVTVCEIPIVKSDGSSLFDWWPKFRAYCQCLCYDQISTKVFLVFNTKFSLSTLLRETFGYSLWYPLVYGGPSYYLVSAVPAWLPVRPVYLWFGVSDIQTRAIVAQTQVTWLASVISHSFRKAMIPVRVSWQFVGWRIRAVCTAGRHSVF